MLYRVSLKDERGELGGGRGTRILREGRRSSDQQQMPQQR